MRLCFCNKVELIQCNVSSAITGWEASTNPDVSFGSSVCFAAGPNMPQYAPYLNQAIFYMLVDTPVTTCIGATCFHIYIHAILSIFLGPLAYMHNSLIGLHLMVVKGILYFEYYKNTLKKTSLCLTQWLGRITDWSWLHCKLPPCRDLKHNQFFAFWEIIISLTLLSRT